MTTLYFIRHAESNFQNHDDLARELTAKGLEDRKLVTRFLADKQVDAVLSSPYRRAVDTVAHFAESRGLPIQTIEDFRERRVDSCWIDDFTAYAKRQWEDFTYKRTDGECLAEVQQRNIQALEQVLAAYPGKTVVIGSHGTALSTIINHYDKSFGYKDFDRIRKLMPWVVKFTFTGRDCVEIKKIDLFQQVYIRKAEPQDISRISEISIFSKRMHYRSIFQNDTVSFGEMQVLPLVKAYLKDPNCLDNIWVYDDAFVKGFIHLEHQEIKELYVEPFFEGQGIGSCLIRFAMDTFGADYLWVLEKNERAIRFYQKHGFLLADECRLEDGTTEYIIKMIQQT